MHLNLHLLDSAYIPFLGIGAWWTIFVLALHSIWSISTSIALIEATVPHRATTPWLGNLGLGLTAVLFVLGAAANTAIGYHTDHFIASPAQLGTSAAIVILLVVFAFLRYQLVIPALLDPVWPASLSRAQSVPSPWLFFFVALAAGSAILVVPKSWGWFAAALILGLELGVAALVLVLSRRAAWRLAHQLALAAGAALSYAWHAFFEAPVLGGTGPSVRVGNGIFALGAILLIAFAARRLRAAQNQPA
jgi:hypothetical protein